MVVVMTQHGPDTLPYRHWIVTAYVAQSLEVLFFSTRLLRSNHIELPVEAELHLVTEN